MKCYVQPYEGDKPYLFLSYCHKNASKIYSIIERLTIDGYRVWYDDGLHPGDDWPEVIAQHLFDSAACIFAVSQEYTQSHNCKNELTYAVNNNKPKVSLILENFKMPRGFSLQISGSNYINYYDFTDSLDGFYSKLEASDVLSSCRESGHLTDHFALAEWKKHTAEYLTEAKKPIPGLFNFSFFKNGKKPTKILSDEASHVSIHDRPENPPEESILDHESGRPASSDTPQSELKIDLGTVVFFPDDEEPQYYDSGDDDAPLSAEEESKPNGEETEVKNLRDILDEDLLEKTAVKNPMVITDDSDPFEKTKARKPKVIPTIAILIRTATGECFRMKEAETSVGRDPDQANFIIDSPMISRRHADILFNDGCFYLKDNDSTNGTFYHEEQLGEEPVKLREFDRFRLDEESIIFVSGNSMKKLLDRKDIGWFATLTAVQTGEERLLDADPLPLNRNNPWKEDVLKDRYINRENHAQILQKADDNYLQDIQSTNGTSLNSNLLQHGEELLLHHGDEIKIVDTPFVYYRYILNLDVEEKQ